MKQDLLLHSMTSAFKGLEPGIKQPTELQLGLHANTVGKKDKAICCVSSFTRHRMPQARHPTSYTNPESVPLFLAKILGFCFLFPFGCCD